MTNIMEYTFRARLSDKSEAEKSPQHILQACPPIGEMYLFKVDQNGSHVGVLSTENPLGIITANPALKDTFIRNKPACQKLICGDGVEINLAEA